jgi:hypothetical protein
MSYETERNRYLIRKYLFMIEQLAKNPSKFSDERIEILTNRINKIDEINKQLAK